MKLLVGLGNPGSRYALHRHNVGFLFLDFLASFDAGEGAWSPKFGGLVTKQMLYGKTFLLLKPQTYMNDSGQALLAALSYYKCSPKDVCVIYDDADLPFGKLRNREGGGHGGHNGIRSIIAAIGSDFCRLKIGVGRPGDEKIPLASWVLSAFSSQELTCLKEEFFPCAKVKIADFFL